jgi:hypothetical protein
MTVVTDQPDVFRRLWAAVPTGAIDPAIADRRFRDALVAVDETGVGDRIGGASQEIGQADGGPDGGRQDGEREIKGAADAFEQGGGRIASGHRC